MPTYTISSHMSLRLWYGGLLNHEKYTHDSFMRRLRPVYGGQSEITETYLITFYSVIVDNNRVIV